MQTQIEISKLDETVARRMREDRAPQLVIDTFLRHLHKLVEGQDGMISRNAISAPTGLPNAEELRGLEEAGRQALGRTLMIKLNGGLGTSMGLNQAKSLIPVKDGRSFLDIIIQQVEHLREKTGSPLPLLLMNSFSTHNDTLKALEQHNRLLDGQRGIPLSFLQHRVPKLRQDTFEPVTWPADPNLEWCPPGHGDLYTALVTGGLLDQLLKAGYEYAFVSNADNLGATLDLQILGHFAARRLPFMMEVTDRTDMDKKGGHLAVSRQGGLLLRESAQCPPEEMDDFQDIAKYRYFNTNNLWLNLPALQRKLKESGFILDLSLIVNRKTVDPRDPKSPGVYQLETAMGSAISLFPDADALRVPRTRFAPVKTTNDLLVLWSDAYRLTPEAHMVLQPVRQHIPPVVHLDPSYYRALDGLLARFPDGAPSLVECDAFTVTGDLHFGKKVIIRGRVELRNASPSPVHVPDAAAFEGQGNIVELGRPV